MNDKETSRVTRKSYARITLALDIVKKHTSGPCAGYHELGIIKHMIDLADTITMEEAPIFSLTCTDPSVPTDTTNICARAVELVRQKYNIAPNVRITIDKKIPAKGGLAGGSSNAATTFLLLAELWKLSCSHDDLVEMGRVLGMDVPYFFTGGTAFDRESTGTVEPIETKLELSLVLVFPPFGVSTKDAYANIDYMAIAHDCALTTAMRAAFVRNDSAGVIASVHNDFEKSVSRQYPELATIKKEIIGCGALAAVMSGSGSTNPTPAIATTQTV